MKKDTNKTGNFIFYQTEDGLSRVEVRVVDDNVWLTQAQIAELYQKDKRTISEHINNIFNERELERNATVRNSRIVQQEGNRHIERDVDLYNLESMKSLTTRL